MGLTTFLNGRAPQRGLAWLALSDTGYILSLTTTSDSGGGASTVWAPSGTVSCRVDPLSGGGSRITGGAIDERSTHMVTAPSDTSVDVRNRISISGRGTFEVTAVRERTGQLTQVFEVLHLQ
jgi:hypothetical protein